MERDEAPRSKTVVWVLTGIGTIVISLIALELWSLARPRPAPTTEAAQAVVEPDDAGAAAP